MANLTNPQAFLLKWLSKEDFSSLGECYGEDLTALVNLGLAKIDHHRVSLTDAGWAAVPPHEHSPATDSSK